jgi:hypothetical protein
MPAKGIQKPIGAAPDGKLVLSAADLPEMGIPSNVWVANHYINIDGWVFPYSLISKPWLQWLQKSFIRWSMEDKSPTNQHWIQGIVSAFENRLDGHA